MHLAVQAVPGKSIFRQRILAQVYPIKGTPVKALISSGPLIAIEISQASPAVAPYSYSFSCYYIYGNAAHCRVFR